VRDPALQERLLAIVRDDVHRLDRLITDISEASRLDAQLSRAKFEPVAVAAMLEGLVQQRRARGIERDVALTLDVAAAAQPAAVLGEGTRLERVFENAIVEARRARGLPRGIRLHLDLPADGAIPMNADGSRLARVFENLIDNALSFSPDGATIRVTVGADPEELVIQVEDEGPGVPEEARDAVFRRFHSVRPASEAFGQHSGLGLAIARTIVDGHGGSIMVESRNDDGPGACFTVRLPRAQEAA
jgi:two-component system, OmpR family, sensor histidine kinase ChvG